MVRINIVCPKILTDQWILAENLEILYLKSNIPKFKGLIPKSFKLGTGHQKFFWDKINYLTYRQYEIKRELILRGFKASLNLPLKIGNIDFKPTCEDKKLIYSRLLERFTQKPNYYHYYGKHIKGDFADFYIKLLEMLIKGEI